MKSSSKGLLAVELLLLMPPSQALAAQFVTGDPASFQRDTYLYNMTTPSHTIIATGIAGENATVLDSYDSPRDPATPFDPVNNPRVEWVHVRIEKNPAVFGDCPLIDGTTNGPPLIAALPTGTLPIPDFQPLPTLIHAGDHALVTIKPQLSHQIKFGFDTLVRRTGTMESWISVGGLQEPQFETGKSYDRSIKMPENMTSGITANLKFDLKTVISYNGVQIDHKEQWAAITVKPKDAFALVDLRKSEVGEFTATATGVTVGATYWIEVSQDLKNWSRDRSFSSATESLLLILPMPQSSGNFYRLSTE